jgi:hypothetical protein
MSFAALLFLSGTPLGEQAFSTLSAEIEAPPHRQQRKKNALLRAPAKKEKRCTKRGLSFGRDVSEFHDTTKVAATRGITTNV